VVSNARTRSAERRSASTNDINGAFSLSTFTVTLVMNTFSGCLASERCLRTSNSTSVAHS